MSVMSYQCQACGWVYPSKQGHDQSELSAGNTVSFNELTDDFSCPLCGVDKSKFSAIEDEKDLTDSMQTVKRACSHISKQQIVVIGAGLAGWSVVDAIRALDKEVGITLIAADNGDRYHKPMLSAAFSQQKTAKDLIRFTASEAAEKANVELLTNTRVHRIDSQNHKLLLQGGELSYQKLVLAVGATPAIPASIATDYVWHINDITNFNKIEKSLSAAGSSQHIAVIGAGMVGTEIAEDLTRAGHKITLLDMNKAPLAMMLPEIATTIIKQALEAQGINFIGNSRVDKVSDIAEGGYQLKLTDCVDGGQQSLRVDHILVSTGLKVEETLPLSAGLTFDRISGIAVQESTLLSSNPDIYAIGDCMSISGIPCRYVAPLRAQAATIAEHLLAHLESCTNPTYEHKAYTHKPPMIRLKNKSISVSATGRPTANEEYAKWQIVSNTQIKAGAEPEKLQGLKLQQLAEDGEVVATVTLKVSS